VPALRAPDIDDEADWYNMHANCMLMALPTRALESVFYLVAGCTLKLAELRQKKLKVNEQ
jgi:hypothetical protein